MSHTIAALVCLCGLAAVAAGAWLVAPAAGLVVGGGMAAGCAVLWERGSQ